jgi:hypothetical protein
MNDAERVVETAEQLADRFEKIGLDENGKMDARDRRLLGRMRKAIAQYRAVAIKSYSSGHRNRFGDSC